MTLAVGSIGAGVLKMPSKTELHAHADAALFLDGHDLEPALAVGLHDAANGQKRDGPTENDL
jgi:hypothetical protein